MVRWEKVRSVGSSVIWLIDTSSTFSMFLAACSMFFSTKAVNLCIHTYIFMNEQYHLVRKRIQHICPPCSSKIVDAAIHVST